MTRSIDSQMKTVDLPNVLIAALKRRGIFHSESDFQHHLAWAIHLACASVQVRLEYPLSKNQNNRRQHCDIVFGNHGVKIGVELKYKTKKLCTTVDQETFDLTDQYALDHGRYDFFKDIARLESWVKSEEIDYGYAVFLTNEQAYWGNSYQLTMDADFKIHENRIAKGCLDWSQNPAKGTTQSREDPINLQGEYTMHWRDSPNKELELQNHFRYLCVEVPA